MKPIDSINIVPLVDVMLVLLTIILVSTSFIKLSQLEINLSQAKHAPTHEQQSKTITIGLSADNQLLYKNKKIIIKHLETILKNLQKDARIILRIDKKTQFQSFANLVDLLKHQQLNNIVILTSKK